MIVSSSFFNACPGQHISCHGKTGTKDDKINTKLLQDLTELNLEECIINLDTLQQL
jgi:hypothetical protein